MSRTSALNLYYKGGCLMCAEACDTCCFGVPVLNFGTNVLKVANMWALVSSGGGLSACKLIGATSFHGYC